MCDYWWMPGAQGKPLLTIPILLQEAEIFAESESCHWEPPLYGVTDGKAVGTYLEHKLQGHLRESFSFPEGNSASGIDFPELAVDIKTTSIKQPQSSCPFTSARQKVYGLGYSLLIFVYDKEDDASRQAAKLKIQHTLYIEGDQTGDYQTTTGLRKLLDNRANEDDVVAFLQERSLPLTRSVHDLSRKRFFLIARPSDI